MPVLSLTVGVLNIYVCFLFTLQHSRELSAVKAEIASHNHELQELHTLLVGPQQGDRQQLDHSGLVQEMRKEIVKLKSQVCVMVCVCECVFVCMYVLCVHVSCECACVYEYV